MSTDFRALCAELHAAFTTYAVDECHHNLLESARAALADEPAVPEGREPAAVTGQPSDEEVEVLVDRLGLIRGHANHPCGFWIDDGDAGAIVRAALARWGRPVPAPPSDGEVAELVADHRDFASWLAREMPRTAELLQRQALVPVSVSERLPGPEDCAPWPGEPDETHWCWAFTKGPLDDDSWERRPVTCLTTYKPVHSHWLPAHALPLPEAE